MTRPPFLPCFALLTVFFALGQKYYLPSGWTFSPTSVPAHAAETVAFCQSLFEPPNPSQDFLRRSRSDRYVPGTDTVLLKDAKIWTGERNGTQVIRGDIILDKGIITDVGDVDLSAYSDDMIVIDVKGAWVTPGLIDTHSHIGDLPSPLLLGALDDNSFKGTIQPWLRSLDALNTHDDSYPLAIAGGVTTALVLPGSVNAIGGQAYVIKLRETKERTPTSMVVEPPYHVNTTVPDPNLPRRWRHMKHACGENPGRTYNDTRMDTAWSMRDAYSAAFELKQRQDEYCLNALHGRWDKIPWDFPKELQWEGLINAHCYEAVDLDDLVRLSNEFKFPIAAVHHSSEAYLVPDLLKEVYGGPPAVALFATYGRAKREAYRASEFAPRILARQELKVMMKSDHPTLNSRYLLYEAQQAHYFGLPYNHAIASVTSTPADAMGMGHRIGYIKKGWDADVAIWDSHPLALGATPTQVFIDGIPQLAAYVIRKPANYQLLPKVPNFDEQTNLTLQYEGLPPLDPGEVLDEFVVFKNIKSIYTRSLGTVESVYTAQDGNNEGVLVTRNGAVLCAGVSTDCLGFVQLDGPRVKVVDVKGGSISPRLVTFGSPLGLGHIDAELSTMDGVVSDPLMDSIYPVQGENFIARAVDGLQFGSRDALPTFIDDVPCILDWLIDLECGNFTTAVPIHSKFYAGIGTAISLGALRRSERGAIIKEATSVHLAVGHFRGGQPSISAQIAALRRLLKDGFYGFSGEWFEKVSKGKLPLIIEAHSADIIATLILLKREIELETQHTIKLTIAGGAEAHLVAKELAEENIGVILNPSRSYPYTWESRRISPGPPFTRHTGLAKLLAHNVTVGIGCEARWAARNLPFDLGWAAIDSGGKINKAEAITLGSTNLEKLLGLDLRDEEVDLVVTEGGEILDMEARVVAVVSPMRKGVYRV
ncbi:carbohydrate esterase family 9 protein [Pluteus cervinus]|uniref:Carbohydrate esterase family 9 protein n=1 Tax=Pluteus cervinus TaxID=181527 RepID=A0ACD3BBI4_9AGAR|nr:carbohydrate esterase family 9 protein [Pluteus cervinus]